MKGLQLKILVVLLMLSLTACGNAALVNGVLYSCTTPCSLDVIALEGSEVAGATLHLTSTDPVIDLKFSVPNDENLLERIRRSTISKWIIVLEPNPGNGLAKALQLAYTDGFGYTQRFWELDRK